MKGRSSINILSKWKAEEDDFFNTKGEDGAAREELLVAEEEFEAPKKKVEEGVEQSMGEIQSLEVESVALDDKEVEKLSRIIVSNCIASAAVIVNIGDWGLESKLYDGDEEPDDEDDEEDRVSILGRENFFLVPLVDELCC